MMTASWSSTGIPTRLFGLDPVCFQIADP
jgi:hypothetical protein